MWRICVIRNGKAIPIKTWQLSTLQRLNWCPTSNGHKLGLSQQAVREATLYAPLLYTATQLQPIHALRLQRPACLAPWIFMTFGRQRLDLGGGVETGVMQINYVVTWTANQSGLVTLTSKVVSESHVTWAMSVSILVFLGLCVLELRPMYTIDR